MEEPTIEYDQGFLDGLKEGRRRLRAEAKKKPDPTEFTKDTRRKIVERKSLLTISGTSGLVADSAFLTTLKMYIDLVEKACDIIDRLSTENEELRDKIAKGFNEAAETLLKKLQAELKAKDEEIERLRTVMLPLKGE